ncbi:MAG: DUF429 domain-containing protein [Desulfobacterales bacterium]|nr:MAG: DUF429 domain-containing protein [Desulfobacterales bacterium]
MGPQEADFHVVGIDLSGPTHARNTVLVILGSRPNALRKVASRSGADDRDIFQSVSQLAQKTLVVVGLDAPLSYHIGGGDRPSDAKLRRKIVQAGMKPGSVMPPTMTRMAYLTLRGMAVSRSLEQIKGYPVRMVEVHPGAAMALRQGPLEHVLNFKTSPASRSALLSWLEDQGLHGITSQDRPSDHYVAACACALAAWKWHRGEPAWVVPARPPYHPYAFAC